jgi:hypothetical protein
MMLPFLLPQFCFFWTLLSFFLFDPDHMKLPHWSRKGKITLVCGQSSNVKIACFHGRREWSYLWILFREILSLISRVKRLYVMMN